MSRFPKAACKLALCLAFLSVSAGIAGEIPPPKTPILHRAPAFATWTITFKYKDEASPQANGKLPQRIKSVTITKTNKTYWEQISLSDGRSYEKWIFDGFELRTTPNGSSIIIIPPPSVDSNDSEYSDYQHSDFEAAQWVSLANYKGTISSDGTLAYQFQAADKTALLSAETQLPLSVTSGEVTRIYSMDPPPASSLKPPPKFLDAIRTHLKAVEALKYRPAPM